MDYKINCYCFDSYCDPIYCIGPTGPMGLPGPTGATGPVPNFTIGTVTTGAPGTNASVKITKV